MMKEKNILQEKFSAGEYLAPRVKVMEVKARRVMCTSPTDGDISSMEQDDETTI